MSDILEHARDVYRVLGKGFSESVYHRSMEVVMRENGISYDTERIVPVHYRGHVVGHQRIDLVINNDTILELKSITSIKSKEITQLRNYMSLTGIRSGHVINFPCGDNADIEVHSEINI
jgi:GxxExxY protein